MKALAISLSVLSLLVLAAHFLRANVPFLVLVCLALIGLFTVRRPWARRTLQIALAFGALEWLRVMLNLAEMRQLKGEPWERMAIILGSVAVVAALAALALEARAMKAYFDPGPGVVPADPDGPG